MKGQQQDCVLYARFGKDPYQVGIALKIMVVIARGYCCLANPSFSVDQQ